MPWFLDIQRRVIEEFDEYDIIDRAHPSCDINYSTIQNEVMIINRNQIQVLYKQVHSCSADKEQAFTIICYFLARRHRKRIYGTREHLTITLKI